MVETLGNSFKFSTCFRFPRCKTQIMKSFFPRFCHMLRWRTLYGGVRGGGAGKRHKKTTLLSLLTKWYLITLPNRLVNHKAKSSFIGSKLASCLLASHWLYWCISERPGPLRTFGLRAVHIIYPLVIPVWETKEQLLLIQASLVNILLPVTK